jgi:hypothetical protein
MINQGTGNKYIYISHGLIYRQRRGGGICTSHKLYPFPYNTPILACNNIMEQVDLPSNLPQIAGYRLHNYMDIIRVLRSQITYPLMLNHSSYRSSILFWCLTNNFEYMIRTLYSAVGLQARRPSVATSIAVASTVITGQLLQLFI